MAVYQTTDQLYQCLEKLFAEMAGNDEHAGKLTQAQLSFRFRCLNPQAQILIDGRQRPYAIQFGATTQRVDLDIQLETDALHQILHGELSLTKAIGRRLLVPSGPVWKATQLADLFNQAQQIYPRIYASCAGVA